MILILEKHDLKPEAQDKRLFEIDKNADLVVEATHAKAWAETVYLSKGESPLEGPCEMRMIKARNEPYHSDVVFTAMIAMEGSELEQ